MDEFFLVFLGAMFAFIFAFIMHSYQKKVQEGQYLSFAVAYISSQMSQLYSLKKDHLIPRYQEVLDLEEKLKLQSQDLRLGLQEIVQVLSNSKHSSSDISLEKLGFLVNSNPNLLVLIKSAFDANAGVYEILQKCNLQIKEVKKYLEDMNIEGQNKISEIWLLMSLNKCLYEQADHALGLLEHTQKQLILFIRNELQHFSIIEECNIDERYADLKPEINSSFLDIIYINKKMNLIKKIKKVFNRLKSW